MKEHLDDIINIFLREREIFAAFVSIKENGVWITDGCPYLNIDKKESYLSGLNELVNKNDEIIRKDRRVSLSEFVNKNKIWLLEIKISIGENKISIFKYENIDNPIKECLLEEENLEESYENMMHDLQRNKVIIKSFVDFSKNELKNNCYIYFLRAGIKDVAFDSSAQIFTKKNITIDNLRLFSSILTSFLTPIVIKKSRLESAKTAVAAIMSRNGSHNIGSHVLSALTHNVGTMPDDRVLYQYIQHRMDYIATVTTDFPSWGSPTMFVGDLMKNFFMQRHLLEYIAQSEGLHAYRFQDRNLNESRRKTQENSIKLFVRKIHPDINLRKNDNSPKWDDVDNAKENVLHFIPYLDLDPYKNHSSTMIFEGDKKDQDSDKNYSHIINYKNGKIDLSHDVQLNIPGGVVGKHAFYTILENVIRNAAKHGWSAVSEEKRGREKNLEVYVDFIIDIKKGNIEFTVWDNMSDVLDTVVIPEKIIPLDYEEELIGNFSDAAMKTCDNVNQGEAERIIAQVLGNIANSETTQIGTESLKTLLNGWKTKINYLALANIFKTTGVELEPYKGTGTSIYDHLGDKQLNALKEEGESKNAIKMALKNHIETFLGKDIQNLLMEDVVSVLKEEIGSTVDTIKNRDDITVFVAKHEKGEVAQNMEVEFKTSIIQSLDEIACKEVLREAIKEVMARKNIQFHELNDEILSQETELICERAIETIAGEIELKLPLRWRQQIFLKKCELQLSPSGNDESGEEGVDPKKKLSNCNLNKIAKHIVEESDIVAPEFPEQWEKQINFAILKKILEKNVCLEYDFQKKDTGTITLRDYLDGESVKVLKEKKNEIEKKFSNFVLPLHWQQQMYLSEPLIKDDDGSLRKENWGLAEMKISAGYLRKCPIDEISNNQLEEKKVEGETLLLPVAMPGICRDPDNDNAGIRCINKGKENGIKCDCEHRFHLGYRFSVPKPKEILIIRGDIEEDKKEGLSKFSAYGISVKSLKETKTDKSIKFNYEYVVDTTGNVLDSEIDSLSKYPCRLLIATQDTVTLPKEIARRIATIKKDEKESLSSILDASDNEKGVKGRAEKIKKIVYHSWLTHLRGHSRGKNSNKIIDIALQLTGDSAEGSGQGLIKDKDLFRVLFVECFHSSVVSFLWGNIKDWDVTKNVLALLALIPIKNDDKELLSYHEKRPVKRNIKEQLERLCLEVKSQIGFSEPFVKLLNLDKKKSEEEKQRLLGKIESESLELVIIEKLFVYLDKSEKESPIYKNLLEFLKNTDKEQFEGIIDEFVCNLNISGKHEKDIFHVSSFGDNVKMFLYDGVNTLNALTDALYSAYLTTDIFLRKYEEKIITLPEGYKSEGNISQLEKGYYVDKEKYKNIGVCFSEKGKIKYKRHDSEKEGGDFYAEALSGTQSYLSSFEHLASMGEKESDCGLVTKMVENALMRVLIIDERVCDFLIKRPEQVEVFKKMEIHAVDTTGSEAPKNGLLPFDWERASRGEFLTGEEAKDSKFDILVIHQGIIDKNEKNNSPNDIEKLINKWEEDIPYVIITTGRGAPSNIPSNAKVLPFSSVEDCLLRKYPEKMILVDTIMNILPSGETR